LGRSHADNFAFELFEQQAHGWILFGAFVQLGARLRRLVNHPGHFTAKPHFDA
jgi:hypothetical protein